MRRAMEVAQALDVGLRSHGVCLPCLGMVADELERGGSRSAEHWVVATLWIEGLGGTVGRALDSAVRRGVPDAAAALEDFRSRHARSAVFRAVVRRLAGELVDETRRAIAASLN